RIYRFDSGAVKPSPELFFEIVHPEDRPFLEHSFDRVLREKSEYDLSFRIVRPDGMIRYIHSVGHPIFDESGALTEVLGAVMDVSDRKRAEDDLHAAEA